MKTRIETLADRARYESKAGGALIGLAIGDAMGDIGRSQDHRARYGIVTNMYPEAKSTDDTEFGVLTALALLDCGGELTPELTAGAWGEYELDRGGGKKRAGRPLYGALANLARGIETVLGIRAGAEFEGHGQQRVAGQDRQRFAVDFVVRRFPAAKIVVVHRREIVVNEGIGVDQFQ